MTFSRILMWFCSPLFFTFACGPDVSAALAQDFTVERLIVAGKDVTEHRAAVGLEDVASERGKANIEIHFRIRPAAPLDTAKLRLDSHWGPKQWGISQRAAHGWSNECEFDPASERGVFRVRDYPIATGRTYSLSLAMSEGMGQTQPLYTFSIHVLPWISRVGISALPAYVIDQLPDSEGNEMPTRAYHEMNRQVAPNTSLFFAIELAPHLLKASEGIKEYVRVILVEMPERDVDQVFAPLRASSDIPKGEEVVIFDPGEGGNQGGFILTAESSRSEHRFWIRHPDPKRPAYANLAYLKPGKFYSLQFELTEGPLAGIRHEATRFGVRQAVEQTGIEIMADYDAPNFVDWHGTWFNGHLIPTNNVPSPGWGGDYLLQWQAQQEYPDLWRIAHFQYQENNFSQGMNTHLNLFRDRSQRVVRAVRQDESGDHILTLGHFAGAEHYHDPDSPSDKITNHPVVGDGSEMVFRVGDEILLQTPVPTLRHGRLLRGTVKAVLPQSNQIIVRTPHAPWAVGTEEPLADYPVVFGNVGDAASTISMARGLSGTYVRLLNGRPYANWGIANHMFDFFIHTMGQKASIELLEPFEFVGDAITGEPSRAGWQLVSDCQYYFTRHLLRRYSADLDTLIHPIFGEGTWKKGSAGRFVALYDYFADGVMRAYEEVLGVDGEDYNRIQIGLGGMHLGWSLEYVIRWMLAHAVPAPLETIFPAGLAGRAGRRDLATEPLGSNPLYFFNEGERESFERNRWAFNACFLDDEGRPVVGEGDWDKEGKLTSRTLARISPTWRNSRWLLKNTRFGKGSPFRMVSVEGYGYTAEAMARCILIEKELLAQIDKNLQESGLDPYVRSYLQGVTGGTVQLALFAWNTGGRYPIGKPFQGTGYWPAYFAHMMRRMVGVAAMHPPGIYNHGRLTFDTFIGPDGGNSGWDSDTAVFHLEGKYPAATHWADLGDGRRIQVQAHAVTVEKDVRNFIRLIGKMTYRMAPLAETVVGSHRMSGLVSRYWQNPPPGVESGNREGDANRFFILLYDHYAADLESQDEMEIPLRLKVTSLPSHVRKARVTVYRIDKEHSSIYPLTEGSEKPSAAGGTRSQEEIEALCKASQLALDEDFPGNGELHSVANGAMDLGLSIGSNRVLFAVVDWNEIAGE